MVQKQRRTSFSFLLISRWGDERKQSSLLIPEGARRRATHIRLRMRSDSSFWFASAGGQSDGTSRTLTTSLKQLQDQIQPNFIFTVQNHQLQMTSQGLYRLWPVWPSDPPTGWGQTSKTPNRETSDTWGGTTEVSHVQDTTTWQERNRSTFSLVHIGLISWKHFFVQKRHLVASSNVIKC